LISERKKTLHPHKKGMAELPFSEGGGGAAMTVDLEKQAG
jgi:hypothetical protein